MDYDAIFNELLNGGSISGDEMAEVIGVDSFRLQEALNWIQKLAAHLIVWEPGADGGNIRIAVGESWLVEDMQEKGGFCKVYLDPYFKSLKEEKDEEARRKILEENMWHTNVVTSKWAIAIAILSLIVSAIALLK